MSTPEQGGVRPDTSGVDFTAQMAAAQASAESATAAQMSAAGQVPGVGAQMQLEQPPSSAGGFGTPLPVVGEGYASTAPDAPMQSGGRPSYSGQAAGDEDPFIGGV